MCVGFNFEEPPLRGNQWGQLQLENLINSKQNDVQQITRNNEERKAKAKDAARIRRTQESEYFEELEKLLLVTGPPPSSQQTSLDKTSVIRLSLAYLKSQNVLQNGLQMTHLREEMFPDIDLFSCLDGFSLLIGFDGDIIFVSENVSQYIGLTQVELLGQEFSDYIHPCDHHKLKLLTPGKSVGREDEPVEIFVRVKCTVTVRGRMINLKQANYKPLKISGKARWMPEHKACRESGTVFLGVAQCVVEMEVMCNQQIGVFTTKHSLDMKFIETNQWMSSVASYSLGTLLGLSFYDLVHGQDIGNVQQSFQILSDHGQCETSPYRLLCCGGGYAWVQTKAWLGTTRQGSRKCQTISCSHQQISEVEDRDQILSIIQANNRICVAPSHTQVLKTKENTGEFETVIFKKVTSKVLPQQRLVKHHPSFRFDMTKKDASSPQSVIVKDHQPGHGDASLSGFQKPVESFEENEGQALKSVKIGKIATESLFSKKMGINCSSQTTSEIKEHSLPIRNLHEEEEFVLNDKDFFDDLFSNLEDLEKLAPYSGAQCIPLSKTDSKTQNLSIVNFDDMILLDFDDDFKFADDLVVGKQNEASANKFDEFNQLMRPIEKLTFDKNPALIVSNSNTMIESNNQNIIVSQENGQAILKEDSQEKIDNHGPRSNKYPVIIQNGSGVKLQGQKLRTETAGDRRRPKKVNSHPLLNYLLTHPIQNLVSRNLNCCQHETEVVSVQKPVAASVEKGGMKLKSVTECLRSRNDSLTTNVEYTFYKDVPSSSVSSSGQQEKLMPIANLYPEDAAGLKDKYIFGDLSSNQGGIEEFVFPSRTSETFNFEDMIFLNSVDDTESSKDYGEFVGGKQNRVPTSEIESLMIPIEKRTFDQKEVLIDPDRHTMWGSDKDNNLESNDCEILPPCHTIGRDNCGSSTKRYPDKIHNPKKRIFDPSDVDPYCLKRIKFGV